MKTIIAILIMMLTTYACQSQDEPLTTLLHPGIYQINNQYFYGERVRTYLVELNDKLLLFDIPTYSRELEAFLLRFEKPVVAILSHGAASRTAPSGKRFWPQRIRPSGRPRPSLAQDGTGCVVY